MRTAATRRFLAIVATVGVTAGLVAVVYPRRTDLTALGLVSVGQVLSVVALTVAAHWLNSLEFWLLYRALGAPLSMTENWMLFTAGQLVNHLPGQAGTAFRFTYLRRVHQLDLGRIATGYGANLILTVLAVGVVSTVGTVVMSLGHDRSASGLLVLFGAMTLGALGVMFIPLPEVRGGGRLSRVWNSAANGWKDIRRAPRVSAWVLALELGKYVLAGFRLRLVFGWFGASEPYALFLVLAGVAGLTTFIAFTPAGLGLREFGMAAVASALGLVFGDTIVAVTVDRAVLMIVTVITGTAGFWLTSRRLYGLPVHAEARRSTLEQ